MMDDHKKRLRLQSSALPVRAHKPRNADELRKKIKQGFEVALSLSASRPRSHASSSTGVDLPGFSPSRPRSHARATGFSSPSPPVVFASRRRSHARAVGLLPSGATSNSRRSRAPHARATGLLPNSALPVRAHRLRNADELRKKIKQDLEAALSFSPSHRQAEEYSGKSQ